MFEIRTISSKEVGALKKLAKDIHANLEACDEDDEFTWFVMNELPADADEDAIEEKIAAIVGQRFERI